MLFSKIYSQNLQVLVKKWLILQDFGKLCLKKSPKTETPQKMGPSRP